MLLISAEATVLTLCLPFARIHTVCTLDQEPSEYDETAEVPGKRPRDDQPQYKLFRWFEVEEEVLEPSLQDNLADILKEEIWPDPLKYYTGAGLEDEEDEDELGEGAAEMLEAEEVRGRTEGVRGSRGSTGALGKGV